MADHVYYMVYKPYGMLSQFTREAPGHSTLADLDFVFPKDVYPVGRLDADSEGLLLLTNDKEQNFNLLNPRKAHPRSYWVQVEGIASATALAQLRQGLDIRIDGKTHHTLPAAVRLLPAAPELPQREPPVRFRKSVPDCWLELTLTEGKNRQVRRMCAAVGFPVLRLVRVRIGKLGWGDAGLGRMAPGEVRVLEEDMLALVRAG